MKQTMTNPIDETGNRQAEVDFDLTNSLAFRMVKLVNVLTREFQREFEADLDLGLPEWRVIAALHRKPGMAAADIARLTGQNPMIISRAVKRLLSMARIERRAMRGDARRFQLFLTAAGTEVFKQISPLAIRWERALVDEMLPQDIISISNLIDGAIERFDS